MSGEQQSVLRVKTCSAVLFPGLTILSFAYISNEKQSWWTGLSIRFVVAVLVVSANVHALSAPGEECCHEEGIDVRIRFMTLTEVTRMLICLSCDSLSMRAMVWYRSA